MTRFVVRYFLVLASLYSFAPPAGAQLGSRLQAGIYGGPTLPTGDFADEAKIGFNAGALIKVRLHGAIDVRLDGAYTRPGSKTFTSGSASVESALSATFGTLNAELNLGPDSASYPGDNSISPYVTVGPGIYRMNAEATCTGDCSLLNVEPIRETAFGFNLGAGANIPLSGIGTFAEVRYHRFSTTFPSTRLEAGATMLTGSIGIKFR